MIGDALKGLLNQKNIDYLTMIIPLLLQMGGLTFAVFADSYISKKHKKVMLIIVCLALSLIVQNYSETVFAAGINTRFPRTLGSIYGYAVRPLIITLFLYIVSPRRDHRAAWILIFVNTVIHVTALFSHICFWFDEKNTYRGGPLSRFCLYTCLVLLGYLLYLTVREYGHVRKMEIVIPVFNVLLVIGAVIMDMSVGYEVQKVTFLTDAVISSCVFFYIWMHLQFVREHEKELKDGQRLQIMLSQIKPHFLYNSLGAIEELCESDPKAAKKATAMFSRYLRGNMNSISATGSIPFKNELSHTKFYLELEKIRFEDALQVKYDIPVTDFMIPTLTLQPIAENAVRHGVRGNIDGRGNVTIRTWEYPDRFEVSVTDDGPGFDPDKFPADVPLHIGLQNVRDRLKQVCGGKLEIESSPGKGTTVTIILPKKGEIRTDGRRSERNI